MERKKSTVQEKHANTRRLKAFTVLEIVISIAITGLLFLFLGNVYLKTMAVGNRMITKQRSAVQQSMELFQIQNDIYNSDSISLLPKEVTLMGSTMVKYSQIKNSDALRCITIGEIEASDTFDIEHKSIVWLIKNSNLIGRHFSAEQRHP